MKIKYLEMDPLEKGISIRREKRRACYSTHFLEDDSSYETTGWAVSPATGAMHETASALCTA